MHDFSSSKRFLSGNKMGLQKSDVRWFDIIKRGEGEVCIIFSDLDGWRQPAALNVAQFLNLESSVMHITADDSRSY